MKLFTKVYIILVILFYSMNYTQGLWHSQDTTDFMTSFNITYKTDTKQMFSILKDIIYRLKIIHQKQEDIEYTIHHLCD